jgi:hypothetical protein
MKADGSLPGDAGLMQISVGAICGGNLTCQYASMPTGSSARSRFYRRGIGSIFCLWQGSGAARACRGSPFRERALVSHPVSRSRRLRAANPNRTTVQESWRRPDGLAGGSRRARAIWHTPLPHLGRDGSIRRQAHFGEGARRPQTLSTHLRDVIRSDGKTGAGAIPTANVIRLVQRENRVTSLADDRIITAASPHLRFAVQVRIAA